MGQIEICGYDYWIDDIFVILGKLSFLKNLLFWEKSVKNGHFSHFGQKGYFGHFGLKWYFGNLSKKGILVIWARKGIFVILHQKGIWVIMTKGHLSNFTLEG